MFVAHDAPAAVEPRCDDRIGKGLGQQFPDFSRFVSRYGSFGQHSFELPVDLRFVGRVLEQFVHQNAVVARREWRVSVSVLEIALRVEPESQPRTDSPGRIGGDGFRLPMLRMQRPFRSSEAKKASRIVLDDASPRFADCGASVVRALDRAHDQAADPLRLFAASGNLDVQFLLGPRRGHVE